MVQRQILRARSFLLAGVLIAAAPEARGDGGLFVHRIELGASGGALRAAKNHELFDALNHTQASLANLGVDLSLRMSYFPIEYLGAELELGFVPTRTTTDRGASVLMVRGHGVLQLPWKVTPFVLAGGGAMGLVSGQDAIGTDFDDAFHWGLGAKVAVSEVLSLRLDGRHIISGATGRGNTDHFEMLFGVTLKIFDVPYEEPPPVVLVAAPAPKAEPEPVQEPPKVEEIAAAAPPPPAEQVEMAMSRVHFAWGKAELRAPDEAALDEAYDLLQKHGDLIVEIQGHTDSTGPEQFNMKLSLRRAMAVKAYLVKKGLDPDRLVSRGYGPHQPIGSNGSRRGRTLNRRTEFTVSGEPPPNLKIKVIDPLEDPNREN